MKEFFLAVIGTMVMAMLVHYTTPAKAQSEYNWENSPYNWKNSEYNYKNSEYNWANSQYNWKNSEYNYNSRNGVYDNNGNRVGYQTTTPDGVKN